MKSQEQRLEECINIRKQLETIGGLLDKERKIMIGRQMNDYIRDGVSFTTKYHLDRDHDVKIIMSENNQCGIVLEKKKRIL